MCQMLHREPMADGAAPDSSALGGEAHFLAQQRALVALQLHAPGGAHGLHAGHLQCGRRRHALALWDGRADEERQARGEGYAQLLRQDDQRSAGVGNPAAQRLAEPPPSQMEAGLTIAPARAVAGTSCAPPAGGRSAVRARTAQPPRAAAALRA